MKAWFCILCTSIILVLGCREQAPGEQDSVPAQSEIARINAAIEDNPGSADPFVERARYHYRQGNYGDAIQDMASAMHRDSMNEEYHLFLADIYLEANKSRFALQTLERSVLLYPQSVDSWLKLAEFQLILKQFDAAATSLRKVLELEPNNIDGLYLLGVLYREQGDFERATKTFQTVVELDGNHAEAWTMLGNLLDIQDDPLALQCFDNAIASDSTYPQGWHSKAFYLQNHNRIGEALEIYQKIQSFAPQYSDAYLNAGILYLEAGDLANARTQLVSLAKLDSLNPLAYYYLGIVEEQSGNDRPALEQYRKARQIAPGVQRFEEAASRLENK